MSAGTDRDAPRADRSDHVAVPLPAPGLGDISGALADLGVFVPLAAALILVNGLDAGAVFVCGGLLVIGAGAAFRIPFPVQPLKALTAVAVARELSPGVIHAAGLELAALLFVLSLGGIADAVARVFVKPVVRSLQLGVGLLLVIAAVRLALHPPAVFSVPASPWPVVTALAAFGGVAIAAHRRHHVWALSLFAAALGATVAATRPDLAGPAFALPRIDLPPVSAFATAFALLVVPQLPLTFGNAVVAVNDLAHEHFGEAARHVRPSRVCLSAGLGNAGSGLLGGMPMCHGAGGLTAHVRLGATTWWMNVFLGSVFLLLGLFFAAQIPVLLGVLPISILAAFLAYAGVRHAWLVADLRGIRLAVAFGAGALGAWSGNLAITAALALVLEHGLRRLDRTRWRAPTDGYPWTPMADPADARDDPLEAVSESTTSAPTEAVRERAAPVPTGAEEAPTGRGRRFVGSTPFLVFVALAIAIVVKTFVIQAFYIPSESMVPTLAVGDRVFVNKFLFDGGDIHRGDVIVFENPNPGELPDRGLVAGFLHWLGEGIGLAQPESEDFIKRVIALPGETIEIRDDVVYIDGEPLDEPYLTERARASNGDYAQHTVPDDALFVMGDNRSNSADSRYGLGFVPVDRVVGRAFVVIWPPSHLGGIG